MWRKLQAIAESVPPSAVFIEFHAFLLARLDTAVEGVSSPLWSSLSEDTRVGKSGSKPQVSISSLYDVYAEA